MRYTILDGFRGFFLLFMAVIHFNGPIGSWLANLHHQHFGWVEDAQGFVFISGMVVGMVYGRKFLKSPSVRAIYRPILERMRTIYSHQLGLVLILLAAALALGANAPPDFGPYQQAPATFTLSSLLLLSSSSNMGILPMYILFLLVTPFAFAMLHRRRVAPFFAIMALAWLSAQSSLYGWAVYQGQLALNEHGIPARFGLYFNLFGWQVLFFTGLYAGFRIAEDKLDLDFLRQAQWRWVFFLALGAFFVLGCYDVLVQTQTLGAEYSNRIMSRNDRSLLGAIYPFAFAIDLFIVVWLLQVGEEDRARWIRSLAVWLRWLFTRPWLVFLGQHSLHVFSFHILVYYLLVTVMPFFTLSQTGKTAVLIVSVASLYLSAHGHRWLVQREKAGAAVAAG
jgi:hypothetical protein